VGAFDAMSLTPEVRAYDRPWRLRELASDPGFSKYVARASTFLRQPSNSSAHNDHFHVRIACPERQEPLCVQNVAVSD
jgi:hypothetical protein